MTPEEMAVLIGVAGYTAWSNTLVGNQAPAIKAYYERAGHPQVGDLVVETSSLGLRMRDGNEPEACVGILVDHKIETMNYDVEEGEEPETYQEEAWYVKVLSRPDDAPSFRWHNASFVAIPRSSHEREAFRSTT